MRKFLVLGILFGLIFAGLSFAQEAQEQPQEQGQPLVFQFFGTTWMPLSGKVLASFDDLDVKVVLIWARDMNGVAGIAEFLIIMREGPNDYKHKIVGGWIQPYSSDEQGFYLKENSELSDLMKKKGEIGEQLEWKGYDDQEGNPILEFYILRAGGPTGGAVIKEVVRTIDIKKFVEEHFKAPEK